MCYSQEQTFMDDRSLITKYLKNLEFQSSLSKHVIKLQTDLKQSLQTELPTSVIWLQLGRTELQ